MNKNALYNRSLPQKEGLGYHSCMDRAPALLIDPSLDPSPVRAALVWGSGIPGCPATKKAPAFLQDLLDRVQAGHQIVSAERKAAVRNMLRHGSFKPAGQEQACQRIPSGSGGGGVSARERTR